MAIRARFPLTDAGALVLALLLTLAIMGGLAWAVLP
jgi:hypothetical protein